MRKRGRGRVSSLYPAIKGSRKKGWSSIRTRQMQRMSVSKILAGKTAKEKINLTSMQHAHAPWGCLVACKGGSPKRELVRVSAWDEHR